MLYRIGSALFLAVLLPACTSLFSGNTQIPIPSASRSEADNRSLDDTSIPLVTHQLNGRPVKIYSAAFDGTGNRRASTDKLIHEPETIVAHISRIVADTHYYPGPGTQSGTITRVLDQAIGFSSKVISRRAVEEFLQDAQYWPAEDQHADIRIAVFGFSRGAAIARDFMNSVEGAWKERFPSRPAPHFYALLFDTVPTGQAEQLQLSVPKSLDYLVHFVALDERRPEFKPYVDAPIDPTLRKPDDLAFSPRRINLVLVPGAHADVGGGYAEGISTVYSVAAEQLLYSMGLIHSNCWNIEMDPMADGMHDSRGVLDKMLGATSPANLPDLRRRWQPVQAAELSLTEAHEIDKRLSALIRARVDAGKTLSITQSRSEPMVLNVVRRADGIELLAPVPEYIDGDTFKVEVDAAGHHITARYRLPTTVQGFRLSIPDHVWEQMADRRLHKLEYGIINIRNLPHIFMLFDKKVVAQEAATSHSEELVGTKINAGCTLTQKGESTLNIFRAVIPSSLEGGVIPSGPASQ